MEDKAWTGASCLSESYWQLVGREQTHHALNSHSVAWDAEKRPDAWHVIGSSLVLSLVMCKRPQQEEVINHLHCPRDDKRVTEQPARCSIAQAS